jgi:uncharacterized protein YbjT (DUF2867 family)
VRTVLVIGATGAQGGSVARHLLADGRWAVRALTRRPDGEAARTLRALGAEVLRGDLDDPMSLARALVDCDGVFGVTSFWEHFDREVEQGRRLLAAVAQARVPHVVLSTLPHVGEITGGTHRVPHFDGKALLEREARAMELDATFVHVAFYFENFLAFVPPRRREDGVWSIALPQGSTPLGAVSVEDVGGVVAEILARRVEGRGALRDRAVPVVGDDLPVAAYAAILARELDREVVYEHVPREAYAALGPPGARELADMFDFYRRFWPDRRPQLAECRAFFPRVRTFDAWARERRAQIVAALDAPVAAVA